MDGDRCGSVNGGTACHELLYAYVYSRHLAVHRRAGSTDRHTTTYQPRTPSTLTEGSELKEHPAFWRKLRTVLTWLGTLHKGGENEAMPTSVQYAGLPWATNITFTISVVNW